jgi:hypothetical protein
MSQQNGAKLNSTILPSKPLHNTRQLTANGRPAPQIEPIGTQYQSGSNEINNDQIEPSETTPLLQNNSSKEPEHLGQFAAGHDVGSDFTWTSSWTGTWTDEEELPEKYRLGPNLPPSTGTPSKRDGKTGSPAMQQPVTVFSFTNVEYDNPPEELYVDQNLRPITRRFPRRDERDRSSETQLPKSSLSSTPSHDVPRKSRENQIGSDLTQTTETSEELASNVSTKSGCDKTEDKISKKKDPLPYHLPQVPSSLRLAKDVPEEPAADEGPAPHPTTSEGIQISEKTLQCGRDDLRVVAAHKHYLAVQVPDTQLQIAYPDGSIITAEQCKSLFIDAGIASEEPQAEKAIDDLFSSPSTKCAGENYTLLGHCLKREDSGYLSEDEESTPQHVEYVGEPSSSRPRFQLESDDSTNLNHIEQSVSEAAFWETLDREENEAEFDTSRAGKSPQRRLRDQARSTNPLTAVEEDESPTGETLSAEILQTAEHTGNSPTRDPSNVSDTLSANARNITTTSVAVEEFSSPESSPVLPNGWNPFDPDPDLYDASPPRRVDRRFIPGEDFDFLSNRPGSSDDLPISSDELLIPSWLFSSDSEGFNASEDLLDRLFREVADVYSGSSPSVNIDEECDTPAVLGLTGDALASTAAPTQVNEGHSTTLLETFPALNVDPFTSYQGVLEMDENRDFPSLEDYPALNADPVMTDALVSGGNEDHPSEYATPEDEIDAFLALYCPDENSEPTVMAHEEQTESRDEDGFSSDEEYHDALMVLQARIDIPDVPLDEQTFSQTRVPYDFDDEFVSGDKFRRARCIPEKPVAEFPGKACSVYSPGSEDSKSDIASLTSLESRRLSRSLSESSARSESSSALVLEHLEYERVPSCQSPVFHPSPIYGWMDDLGISEGSEDAHIISPKYSKPKTGDESHWPDFSGIAPKTPEPVSHSPQPTTPPSLNSRTFKPDPTSPEFIPTTPSAQLREAPQFLYDQWKSEHLPAQERKLQAFRGRMKEVREEYEAFVEAGCGEDEMDEDWEDDEVFYVHGPARRNVLGKKGGGE